MNRRSDPKANVISIREILNADYRHYHYASVKYLVNLLILQRYRVMPAVFCNAEFCKVRLQLRAIGWGRNPQSPKGYRLLATAPLEKEPSLTTAALSP